jgi:hypothetical protein
MISAAKTMAILAKYLVIHEREKEMENLTLNLSFDSFLLKDLPLSLERNTHTSNHASTKESLLYL